MLIDNQMSQNMLVNGFALIHIIAFAKLKPYFKLVYTYIIHVLKFICYER